MKFLIEINKFKKNKLIRNSLLFLKFKIKIIKS